MVTEENSTLFSTKYASYLHVFISVTYFAMVTDNPAQLYA